MSKKAHSKPGNSPPSEPGKGKISILPVWVLIMVACCQIWMAHNHLLSPWKGGGFGMFAVADAPATRFLSFDAIDKEGQPLVIDAQGFWPKKKDMFLRSMPSQKTLATLADELMEESFVPVGNSFDRALRAFMEQNPEAQIDDISEQTPKEQKMYRVSRDGDDPEIRAKAKRLNGLRIQMWRVVFNAEKQAIGAEPILKPVMRGAFH